MNQHETINYLEFPARDMAATKTFFNTVFNWQFVDYGPEYIAIDGAGIDGGFYLTDVCSTQATGSVLVVFYSESLDETQKKVEQAGGAIVREKFGFPGGHRFHFSDPNGNEFAVWSDKEL